MHTRPITAGASTIAKSISVSIALQTGQKRCRTWRPEHSVTPCIAKSAPQARAVSQVGSRLRPMHGNHRI